MEQIDEIVRMRAEIGEQRKALDAREADLATTERILREIERRKAIGGTYQPETVVVRLPVPAPPRKRGKRGSGGQYTTTLEILREAGGTMQRPRLRAALEERRGQPMSNNAFSTMLSKMAGEAGMITRNGLFISIAQKGEEADVITSG